MVDDRGTVLVTGNCGPAVFPMSRLPTTTAPPTRKAATIHLRLRRRREVNALGVLTATLQRAIL